MTRHICVEDSVPDRDPPPDCFCGTAWSGRLPGGPTLAPIEPDSDMLTAIRELITAINGLTNLLKPDSPGPARGVITNIRALAEHKHQTGHRMGFGPVNVHEEQR